MRVRAPRLLVKVVSKRNLQRRDAAASIDATGRNQKWAELSGNLLPTKIGSVLRNTFCSIKAAELACCGGRKINMLKELVADRLRTVKILGIKQGNSKGERENLGLLWRIKKRTGSALKLKKKIGFRLRKWKISRKGCMKRFGRIGRSPKFMLRKMRKPEEEVELCKKRILMGDKCKPLNISGSLHYDKNGVLLPELLLPCE